MYLRARRVPPARTGQHGRARVHRPRDLRERLGGLLHRVRRAHARGADARQERRSERKRAGEPLPLRHRNRNDNVHRHGQYQRLPREYRGREYLEEEVTEERVKKSGRRRILKTSRSARRRTGIRLPMGVICCSRAQSDLTGYSTANPPQGTCAAGYGAPYSGIAMRCIATTRNVAGEGDAPLVCVSCDRSGAAPVSNAFSLMLPVVKVPPAGAGAGDVRRWGICVLRFGRSVGAAGR